MNMEMMITKRLKMSIMLFLLVMIIVALGLLCLSMMRSASEMGRLNSGIFSSFEPKEWNLNLNSSDCSAWKMIKNDAKLESISWDLKIENRFLNFCVGVWVGGHLATIFSQRSKDAHENSTSFDTNLQGANWRNNLFSNKIFKKLLFATTLLNFHGFSFSWTS